MILHCNTLKHPLVNNGTQQRDRLLLSLIPEGLKLDDRSMEELIAFAGTLSAHIRFWDENNQPAGDWLNFWESDNTSLFAILAATDLESPRAEYRQKEIEYYNLKKKEDQGTNTANDPASASVIDNMVANPAYGIYGLASLILKICNKIPQSHPLKQDIINIISGSLQESLMSLVRFHKAIDAQAIKKYGGFIGTTDCAAPWNLKDNAAFECIDFVKPYEYAEELWKLFLTFYKALTIIVEKVKKAFQSSLRSRKDHLPQITLFISFLYLFRYLQDDLNSLTGKHLMYYYHDILQLEKRRLIPDKVHIVFEIATNIARYKIERGTELKAGADELGIPLTYALKDELVISPAKLIEIKNLYATETIDEKGNKFINAIMLPSADKRDGFEEEWPAGTKAWHPLSGYPVYERLKYRLDKIRDLQNKFDRNILPESAKLEYQKYSKSLQQLNAFSGFSISSYEFWLNKGFLRIISIEFETFQLDNLMEEYSIELSTEAGMIRLKPYFTEIDNNAPDDKTGAPESATVILRQFSHERRVQIKSDEDYERLNRVVKIRNTQRYLIILHAEFPSVLPIENQKPPFLQFKSLENFGTSLSNINLVKIYSFSEGSLDPYKKSLPGVFFKEGEEGEISANELVITSTGIQTVLLRVPEIFAKKTEYLKVVLPPPFAEQNFSILSGDQWIEIPNDNLPIINNYKETNDLPAAPEYLIFDDLAHNADGWILMKFRITDNDDVPNVLDTLNLRITYRSNVLEIPLKPERASSRHFISYITSLGEWKADLAGHLSLRPNPAIEQPSLKLKVDDQLFEKVTTAKPLANGNLFLGLEKIVPNQTLSLLIKTAEGTGNPDHYAPNIVWSYLRDNQWFEIPPQFILNDSSLGMKQTGILLFQVPDDINNGNTWIKGKENRTDLYWFRASATEIPEDLVLVDALPMLKEIYANAAEAEFVNNNNSEKHLINGILPGTINSLKFRDVNVKTVLQPYDSFSGRQSEKSDQYGYLQRVNERLRHKDRAVTIWDYERLTLQQFPKVSVVKCASHTRRTNTARPGSVTVAAVPFPHTMTGNRIYYPIFSAGDLESMKQFLIRRNSYFVGGYGDPEFCCCEDGCDCEHGRSRIHVTNARFEPVRFKVCVRFYEGKDIPYYKKQLNEDLKAFLAPWASEKTPLVFGMPVSLTRLLRFLENLNYVDVILGLEVKHFSSRKMAEEFEDNIPWSSPRQIIPFTTISVLTTYLDKLNEDNPNVIDHEINVIASHDKCTCPGCTEKAAPVADPNEEFVNGFRNTVHNLWFQHKNVNTVIREFKRVLDEQVDAGVLKGNKVINPEDGNEGTDAYRIEKIKVNGKIRQLAVKVAFVANKPFTVFHVNNPNN